ncbi:MAG: alpha/beta hydrolase [Bacteroidota bacterium]
MGTKNRNFIKYAIVASIVVLSLLVFIPRTYKVPGLSPRTAIRYWDLSTGSHIAYTHLEAKGTKKTTPVIFLQGGPGGPIYDHNIKSLSPLADSGFEVYLYDQIGCGFSDRLQNIIEYTVDRNKLDLEAIIKTIGAPKVILIGQSWGAVLAAAFVTDHAAQVDKIVFTGPGPILPMRKELEKIKPPDSLHLKKPFFTNRMGKEKAYNLRARFVEFCATTFDFKLAPDNEMDDFAALLNFEMNRSTLCDTTQHGKLTSGSGYYAMVKTTQSFETYIDNRQKLKQCKVPVLVMRGQCDGMKWGYAKEYLELFANHKLVIIPNAGHAIDAEQPELYINTILHFLSK